ncbi:MAG TPA: prolyl oligopeptidase family serine peptidase, partial [Steroidobacteraceae bacterium]|nr:prolyl oligopeptidase family serine peptidase [Steroidobacteraceae bacterium]
MHTFSYGRSGLRASLLAAWRTFLFATVLVLITAGCDSGNGDDDDDGDDGGTPSRGELVSDPTLVRVVEAAELLDGIDEALRLAVLLQAGSPVCDIALYKIEYATVGGQGEDTTASGALMAPTGTNANCTGARPVVLYAHGTSTDRDYDITNFDAATENPEGLLIAAFFAAQGYLVVAPNYAGYDVSALPYHPYLVADQQSADMVDALAAARSALPVAGTDSTDSGRLYVTGYSQGGYVAMATHRALEAGGVPVTASAPMSGPYALAAFVDAVFAGRVNGGATVQGTFLFTAYQRAFGNVYSSADELFEAQYADEIETLFPSDLPRSELYDQGKLPRDAFFSAEPPAPEYADITPPSSPAEFVPLYQRGFASSDFLIRNDYRLAYLQDMQASPDGYWPDLSSAEPPASPALPLRQALAANDLRDWTPEAPTLLCGGHDDPTVYWLNSEAMNAYWSSHAADAPVSILDVDAAPSGDADPYGDLKRRFGLAKDLLRAQGGSEAVLDSYHAGLVPAFCLEAA